MAHALIGIVLAAVTSAIARLAGDELKAWNPRVTSLLVRLAVSRLPRQDRQRYSEEWRAHINDVPGELWKLCAAIGCIWASLIRSENVGRPLVDRKGRLKVPVRLRNVLEENYGPTFYITSLDGRVAQVYPFEEWERIEKKLAGLSNLNPTKRKFLDRTNYYGQLVEMDMQGRLLIPPILRETAQIKGEVEVTVIPVREDMETDDEMVERSGICYFVVRSTQLPVAAHRFLRFL